jgi:hypothetical protein
VKRLLLSLCLLSATTVGLTLVNAAPAAAGGLNAARTCANFETGDHLRMLSACTRYWVDDTITQVRGVVEMHTYASVNGSWVDSTSQSVTINYAVFNILGATGNNTFTRFGNDISGTTCRINGPAGTIGCSVPNTARVAFYSAGVNGAFDLFHDNLETCADKLSWRDDRGQAHFVTAANFPATVPLCFFSQEV